MRYFHPSLVLASMLLTLVPGARAQGAGQPGSPPTPPPPIGDAHFGEIVAGHFTSRLHVDAAFLDDDELVLLMLPEVFRTRVSGGYTTSVNDVAAFPEPVTDGFDGLLVVGPSGLQRLTWNLASESWDVLTVGTSAWEDARLVEVGDLDGAGEVDVVAAGAASDTVLVAHGVIGGTFGSTTTFTTDSGEAIREVHLLDWDPPGGPYDASDEIVLVTDAGVEVYDAGGVLLDAVAWTAWPLIGVEVHGQGGMQRLAAVTSTDGGITESVVVLSRWGTEGPFAIGSPGVVSVDTWDHDGDGDTDLVFNIDSAPELLRLRFHSPNEPGATATFDPSTGLSSLPFGDPGRDPSGNAARVVVADFDHDGDEDLLAPAQGDYNGGIPGSAVFSEVHLLRGVEAAPHGALQVGMSAAFIGAPEGGPETENHAWFSLAPPSQDITLKPGLTLKWTFDVWRADALDGRMDADPHHTSGPLPPTIDDYWFDLEQSSITFDDIYIVVVRQVGVDGSNVVKQVGPAHSGLFGDMTSYEAIVQLPGLVTATAAFDSGDEGSEAGGLGTGPTPPDSDEDEGVRGTGGTAGGSAGGSMP